MFTNILNHRNYRYLWLALLLGFACWILYTSHADFPAPSGSTWQGYILGTIGALLIVWLALLGLRKRSYKSNLGAVKGWVSAHVYLGTILVLVVSLHTGFQFGWNVHSLAYTLMILVVASGIYGLNAYLRYPARLSATRAGNPRAEMFGELFELNKQTLQLAQQCQSDINDMVTSSVRGTQLGGGVFAQLSGRDHSVLSRAGDQLDNPDQETAINIISSRIPRSAREIESVVLQELLTAMCRRQNILRRIRLDIMYQSRVQLWLYVHVPISIALIASLLVHILTVFLYW